MPFTIVDVSGYDLGAPLAAESGPDALLGDESALHEPTGLIALVPARLGQAVPDTSEFWFRLDRAVSNPEARAAAPEWIVVVWAVRVTERPTFATPYDIEETEHGERRHGGHNAALLMVGAGWRRELGLHDGNAAAALRCRSNQFERVLDADSHRRVAGVDARRARRDLRSLDPHVLHCVMVEVEPAATAVRRRWAGWESVSAATALRHAASGQRRPGKLRA